jgi:hypothetical protein
MRRLRQLSMAVFLTLTLGTYAFAGIIDTPPAPPPEPPPASATGIIGTVPGDAQSETPATDPVVDIALGLLQSALSLF